MPPQQRQRLLDVVGDRLNLGAHAGLPVLSLLLGG
jgi:hypothetical protein